MTNTINKTIAIAAPVYKVWATLTNPVIMKQWMADPEIGIEIITDWTIGSPVIIKGFHHLMFENKGMVLQFEPDQLLRYDYLSSLSQLPDVPENYSVIEFRLTPVADQTSLNLTISNFPTEAILRHIDFYWSTAIELIRKRAEQVS